MGYIFDIGGCLGVIFGIPNSWAPVLVDRCLRLASDSTSSVSKSHIALIAGSGPGIAALVIHYMGDEKTVGAALLNMVVFGAVIAYMLQMLSCILLRLPHIKRPCHSPLNLGGAVFALVISTVTLSALFVIGEVCRKVVIGVALTKFG
ncbi:MAG: hypothetical protein M2R45_04258 [Verrucomicrobia subdivision 3 bacterium]|nr:hypothetical protein [Limisphaerales bacterium]MCS1412615.1 hypothetical protein [Limisphaerales bacterium]